MPPNGPSPTADTGPVPFGHHPHGPDPHALAPDHERYDAVVIGAGAIGLCIAHELAERGLRLAVVDKGGVAAGASFGNAGLISYGHAPLARPGMCRALLRSMGSPRAPFHVSAGQAARMAPWLWGFARACAPERLEGSMRLIVELSRLARAGFERAAGPLALDFDYRAGGYMDVHRSPASLERAAAIAAIATAMGIRETPIGPDAAIARQPAIREGIAGAILHEDAAFAHPAKFCQALAHRLRSMGVAIRTGVGVGDIAVERDRAVGLAMADGTTIHAETVVLAAGPWSPAIAAKIGVRVPMQPGKGYHTTVTTPDADPPSIPTALMPTEAINFPDDWVAMTPLDGQLRLAGTLEFEGLNHTMRDERLAQLLDAVPRNLRWSATPQPIGRWCGLRPCTPDGMPIIGWSAKVQRFFVATGHAMMGFWTAPATGTLTAQLITAQPTAMDTTAFAVERF